MSVDRERARGFTAIQAAREWTRADGAPVRVLVVDDEVSVTDLLAKAFRDDGWEVVVAGDGRAAIRAAQEFHPDAVVLDVTLPHLGGLEVLRQLRAHATGMCPVPLGPRCGRGPDCGHCRRRRRLRDQAVQPRRGGHSAPRVAPPIRAG